RASDGEPFDGRADDAVARDPDVHDGHAPDLEVQADRRRGMADRGVADAGAAAEPAPDLDEPLVLEDPQRLTHDPLGHAELLAEVVLDGQGITVTKLAAGDLAPDLGGDRVCGLHVPLRMAGGTNRLLF